MALDYTSAFDPAQYDKYADVAKYNPYTTDLGLDLSKYSLDKAAPDKGFHLLKAIALGGEVLGQASNVVNAFKGRPGTYKSNAFRLASPNLGNKLDLLGTRSTSPFESAMNEKNKADIVQSIISSFVS